MNLRAITLGLALGFGLYGLWQLTAVAVFHAKAWVAPHLIAKAWTKTLEGGEATPPWPWADTWPVAYVTWEASGSEYPILKSAVGRTLAFSPGHLDGSARPGQLGLMVVAGHRDTHLEHLKDVKIGSRLNMQDADNVWYQYRVTETAVVHADDRVHINPETSKVVFVTCWPFGAIDTGGPMRFAVFAELEHKRERKQD